MSTTIEKLAGGYVVTTVHGERQVASAEHVARIIHRYWHDVMHHIRELECDMHDAHRWENEGGSPPPVK